VFTAVLAPRDGRKNWPDILTAFLAAFGKTPDATLVFKMIGPDPAFWWWEFNDIMSRYGAVACRVIVLQGFLDQARYEALIAASHWAVNASLGEGQCLPLMEFMSAGRPAIAPAHSAMADYISQDNAMIVGSDPEYCAWPHDTRNLLTTERHRIDWVSLRDAMMDAYRISRYDISKYRAMAGAAIESSRLFCSDDVVASRLAAFLGLDRPAAQPGGMVGKVA
jgi:glycosyltransferase involved in cell wall biosynthesis